MHHARRSTGTSARVRRIAAVMPAVTASVVLGTPAAAATTDPRVLATTIRFPGGAPASGAEFRLLAQPDPVIRAVPAESAEHDPRIPAEILVATGIADARGRIAVDIPETPALLDLAERQGGRVRTVLAYTAQSHDGSGPIDFKGLTPVELTLGDGFRVPPVTVQVLRPLPEFDATIVQQLAEQTLAQVGELADTADPLVAQGMAALDQEMARRGYLFDNEAVAYNIDTADGMVTWITYSPEHILVRHSDDADVYDVLPLTSGGFPAVDTTDAGDALDDVTMETELLGRSTKQERGRWAHHHGNCYHVIGPADTGTSRYTRNVCYTVDHQELDTVKGTSFWQFSMESHGNALAGNDMFRIWVHGQPYYHGTAPMTRDGLPKPRETDTTEGSCTTTTEQFSIESGEPVKVGFSRSWTKTKCRYSWYGPVLFGDAGNHASEWETEEGLREDHVRYVKLITPVHTPTREGTPVWNILSGQWVRR